MSKNYLYGYEAMKLILRALGIDIDADHYTIQRIQIELAFDMYPIVYITCAPDSALFDDKDAMNALKDANVIVCQEFDDVISPEVIERLVRKEVREVFREGYAVARGKIDLSVDQDSGDISIAGFGPVEIVGDDD